MNIKNQAQELRAEVLETAKKVDALRKQGVKAMDAMTGAVQGADQGEIIANITLAYRNLEDARMRLGKAIQAFDGGESIYPK